MTWIRIPIVVPFLILKINNESTKKSSNLGIHIQNTLHYPTNPKHSTPPQWHTINIHFTTHNPFCQRRKSNNYKQNKQANSIKLIHPYTETSKHQHFQALRNKENEKKIKMYFKIYFHTHDETEHKTNKKKEALTFTKRLFHKFQHFRQAHQDTLQKRHIPNISFRKQIPPPNHSCSKLSKHFTITSTKRNKKLTKKDNAQKITISKQTEQKNPHH